jgi:signal transduction histidine kinase
VAGLLFNPLRLTLGRWVDRTFFKLEHDLTRATRELERDLRAATGQADLARRLAVHLDRNLRPREHGVLVRDGDRLLLAGNLPVTDAAAWLQEATGSAPGTSLLAAPRSTSLPDIESPDFPAVLQQAGVVLAATIQGDDGPAGLILLGPRDPARFYIEADVDHLVRCATTAAENLERLLLVQTVAEEAMARHRLDELNQLKNEFFSRVAHDLRTPLASISWSVQNLRDGLAGELSAPQRDYVGSMDAAAAHLNRLVSNLLEISRLERADYRIETESLHLPGVLEEAVRALEPLAATRSVRFVVHGAADSRPVLGNAERLGEVVVNLLENALRFSPNASQVEIVLQEPANGHLAFSVRDHGPGLGGLDPTQLFARFGQGIPSPYSQEHGFGLGLHIAKSHVELMGGSVEAADHPAGGAVFTVRLALSPDPEARA